MSLNHFRPTQGPIREKVVELDKLKGFKFEGRVNQVFIFNLLMNNPSNLF